MTTSIKSSADGTQAIIQVNGVDRAIIDSTGIKAGSYAPSSITSNEIADGALIENSANGLGYGTGSGGTVTQVTSKSTTVTLNKPTGSIVLNGSALASGATAVFVLYNSLIGANDTLLLTLGGEMSNMITYNIWSYCGAYAAQIAIKNISGGSLSETPTINFAIIKGAVS